MEKKETIGIVEWIIMIGAVIGGLFALAIFVVTVRFLWNVPSALDRIATAVENLVEEKYED